MTHDSEHLSPPAEHDCRDDDPLSDCIRDVHTEALNAGQSWNTTSIPTEERNYAMKRADALEAERDRYREALDRYAAWIERDRREPDKILTYAQSMRREALR